MIILTIIGWLLLGILALIALLLLLCCFSARLRVSYLKGEASVTAHFLFLRFRIFPGKEKPDKPILEKKAKKEKKKIKEPEPPPEKEKRPWREVWEQYRPLLRTAKETLRTFCKRIVIYRVEAGVDVGGEDAHKAALAYATTAAFAAILMELCDELFTFRRKYIRISPDFLHEGITVNLSLRIRIRPIFALIAGARLFFAYLGAQPSHKSKHNQKGGQQYESAASHR